ncbi:phospholipase D/nuclease [Trichocladium antarcticum]|uniref:Phospholipase D/nuclease n=1 Tax=Trichocladium antarcticum TaxID=1450529 RepID=A0AAN6ZFK6_9PEZI|nr:phospholipase D/nuclease [Trichocladium antarcticum]
MADNRAMSNGSDDEDEDLRIAIALSLGQDPGKRPGGPGKPGPIDLTQDDDSTDSGDGEGGDGEDAKGVVPADPAASKTSAQKPAVPAGPMLSDLGLDREKMEEERLARLLSKRKASALGDAPPSRQAQRPRTAAGPPSLLSRAAPAETGMPAVSMANTAVSSGAVVRSALPFPAGVVKKTWAYGQPRRGDDIKIEEVLQKHQLQLAVISSFQWDEAWMLSKIDVARTKLVLIAFATGEAQKEEMRNNVPRDRIRFCFPPMQAMGSMHSKLQLLKYETYMRIVVPTGNLMSYDWGETGTMENMVFLIDLPKLQTAEQRDAQQMPPFGEELSYFLRAQGLDEKLVSSLRNYDFSETSRYNFVHTIPGSHTADDAWRRTGYCGLGRAVNALGLSSPNPIEMDIVCASLGAVNYSLLGALYHACQGDSGLKEYNSRTSGRKGKNGTSADDTPNTIRDHSRVYFPSSETVQQSKGGRNGAGTICFQARWWKAESFPHDVLRDCRSTRPGVLMHSKVLYVRGPATTTLSNSTIRFAYVGSANLSESAWGRLVKDRGTGKPKMSCRNWECGVLVQGPAAPDSSGLGSDVRKEAAREEATRIPVPMELPGQPFAAGLGGRTPWFFQERN